MTKEEHDKAVESLKEICREIGCSGLSPAMCDYAPQRCGIIRKLVMPANKAYTRPPMGVAQYDTGHPNPMFIYRESRTDGGG